jgi:hypothetical protein
MASPYALDFSPVANALSEARQHGLALQQQEMARNRLAMEQESHKANMALQPFKVQTLKNQVSAGQMENMGARAKLLGGVGQALLAEADPAKKQGYVKQMIASIPDMKEDLDKALPPGWDANPDLVGHYVTHLARGYQDKNVAAKLEADVKAAQAQATIAQDKAKDAEDPNRIYARRADAATRHGGDVLKPGGREYNEFVLTGDFPKLAAQKDSLEAQAAARKLEAERIGLKPDHPAYQSYILTGKMPREDQAPLTATDKKAILEADEMVLSTRNAQRGLNRAVELNNKAYDTWLAGARGTVTGNLGSKSGQATQEMSQVVTEQALSQLKAIFGAAPTEGERKILLDIQGSVNQPRDVRARIFARAIEAAQVREKFYEERARELRGQTFFKPHGASAATPAPQTPAPTTGSSNAIPRIRNDAEYDALNPGTRFIDPNGKARVKP